MRESKLLLGAFVKLGLRLPVSSRESRAVMKFIRRGPRERAFVEYIASDERVRQELERMGDGEGREGIAGVFTSFFHMFKN